MQAQPAPPVLASRFERVLEDQGLPGRSVTALLVDRAGFLWIGTRAGLVLFDGYETRVFQHDLADAGTLADNSIRTLYEDRQGHLWVGTNAGGLNRLDRATWRVTRFQHDPANPRSLSHNSVYAVLEDWRGQLWVGTQEGLNRFDRATGTFERIPSDGAPDGLTHEYVMALLEDDGGRLWVATLGGGLNVRDPATGAFSARRHDPAARDSLSHDHVHALALTPEGRLFVGTRAGVDELDPERGRLSSVTAGQTVTALAVSNGTVWVAELPGNVRRLAAQPGSGVVPGPAQAVGDGDAMISAMLVDARGALWAGTFGGGLFRARASPGSPRSVPIESPLTGRPVPLDVTGVLEDARGDLVVGGFGGGVVRLPAAGGRPRGFLQDPGGMGRHDGVTCLAAGADGTYWVGAMDGLHRVDATTGRHVSFRHRPGDEATLGPGYVTAFLEDRRGRRWVGVGGSGLHQIDGDGRVVRRVSRREGHGASLADDYVTALAEAPDGALWIGTRGGLHRYDPDTTAMRRFTPGPNGAGTLGNPIVTCVLFDSRGRLWVGTGGGLSLVEPGNSPATPTVTAFTTRDGLVADDITALVEDDDGSLWVTTRAGLSRFDPATRRTVGFLAADGLPSTEFNAGAAWRGRSWIYFGTRRGVVAVARGTPFPPATPSPTVVTAILTEGGEVTGTVPAWERTDVEVPYGQWVSLRFGVLEYDGAYRHRFAYRLANDGEDRGWVDLATRRELTIHRLLPGRYVVEIRGRNSRGVLSTPAHPLVITVHPPFWQSWPVRAGALASLAAALYAGYRARTARLRRRNTELLALQAEREAAYTRLREATRHLEAVKEEERRHIGRELHDELGQDLTTAKINLYLASHAPSADAARQRLDQTAAIVDGLIERVRSLSLDLRPPLLDELGLAAALSAYVEAVASRTSARVVADVPEAGLRLSPEIEITAYRVAQEALTNALRHARASSVRVSLTIVAGVSVDVEVVDDGEGFDAEGMLRGGPRGRHLGLLGMQERVALVGGRLVVESAAGRGTRVSASLPFRDKEE